MLAFDTNHLVRFLVQDDAAQCAIVTAIIEKESRKDASILLLDLVLLETNWVLETTLCVSREGWAEILECLLNDPFFTFEDSDRLRLVLQRFRKGKANFSDYMIWAKAKRESCALKTFAFPRVTSSMPFRATAKANTPSGSTCNGASPFHGRNQAMILSRSRITINSQTGEHHERTTSQPAPRRDAEGDP